MTAMNPLNPFDFEGRALRLATDAAGNPWFHAGDVCAALELTNPWKAVADHVDPDDLTKREVIDSLGRTQEANYVNESGLYALIFGSTKEAAKRFKRWVTSEVLPALRRTGSYAMPEAPRHEAGSELPPSPGHRADYVVSASRGFAALMRAGRQFGLGQRAAARRANAATEALTGVNLAELLGAQALMDEPEPAPFVDPGAREREYLRAWLEGRDEVTNDEVVDAMGLPRDRPSHMRAAFSMHRLGWIKTRTLQPDGTRSVRYRRPGFQAGAADAGVPA